MDFSEPGIRSHSAPSTLVLQVGKAVVEAGVVDQMIDLPHAELAGQYGYEALYKLVEELCD